MERFEISRNQLLMVPQTGLPEAGLLKNIMVSCYILFQGKFNRFWGTLTERQKYDLNLCAVNSLDLV